MIDRPKVDSKWPKDQELYFVGARCQAAFKNTDFAVGVFIKLILVHYTPVPPEAQQLRNFYNTQSSDRWHIMTIVIHGNYEIVIADQHDTRFIIPHTSQVAIITSSTITTILPSPSSDFGKKIALWSTHNLRHQINHIIHRNEAENSQDRCTVFAWYVVKREAVVRASRFVTKQHFLIILIFFIIPYHSSPTIVYHGHGDLDRSTAGNRLNYFRALPVHLRRNRSDVVCVSDSNENQHLVPRKHILHKLVNESNNRC